jgi:protoporphyrinogen IX oxidase
MAALPTPNVTRCSLAVRGMHRGPFGSTVLAVPSPIQLVALHVLANVVWIGALLSVALLTARAPFVADPAEVGMLARRVYTRLAIPAFLVSLGAGAGKIALAPQIYAHLTWMHAKLGFAFLVIVLHHSIGARARRVANGNSAAGRGVGWLAIATFLCVAGAVWLGVAKSLPEMPWSARVHARSLE